MNLSKFTTPCRLYSIPAKLLYHPTTFEKFKTWVKSQGLVINSETPFCFQRANGRHCRSFKNGTCTRQFLAVARHFLMEQCDYYPVGTRPYAFHERRRIAPLTLGQFIKQQNML